MDIRELGKFTLLEHMGKGSVATVYRATCNETLWSDLRGCWGIRGDRDARRQCMMDAKAARELCLDGCDEPSCGEVATACWQDCSEP